MEGIHARSAPTPTPRPVSSTIIPPSPFDDPITAIPGSTPYGSRPGSMPASVPGSTSGFSAPGLNAPQRYFHSRRVKKGEVSQPWLSKKDPREKWVTIIPCIGLAVGLAIAAFLVWHGISSVVNHKYCPVLMEDWSHGFREDIWSREVEVGGYGLVMALRCTIYVCSHKSSLETANLSTRPPQTKTRSLAKMASSTFDLPSRTKNSCPPTAFSISRPWASVHPRSSSTVSPQPT